MPHPVVSAYNSRSQIVRNW